MARIDYIVANLRFAMDGLSDAEQEGLLEMADLRGEQSERATLFLGGLTIRGIAESYDPPVSRTAVLQSLLPAGSKLYRARLRWNAKHGG